ncbi:MAG: hypothetical protein ABSF84_03570 [Acidimicrobiales bacterium]
MATAKRTAHDDGVERIIDSLADAERSALEAVRNFLDSVNGAFPHGENGGRSRQKIIDSAFRMTEELVGSSNEFAHRLIRVGGDVAKRAPARRGGAKRSGAVRAAATKAAPRKAVATKAAPRKAVATKAAPAKTAGRKAAARKAPARKAPAA